MPIITLTTDFGTTDHYVSALKAVILSINPEVRLVDISHHIPPQDIMAAAWVLKNTVYLYPPGTIHLAVVDPGVGTPRKPLVAKIKDQYFVGPDNGLFSLIAEQEPITAYHLNNTSFWFNQRSNTFHGRDIFSPVAAHLSNGTSIHMMGELMDDIVRYRWATPVANEDGIHGWVVHIDGYGNLITNIDRELLRKIVGNRNFKIFVGNTILNEIVTTFASVSDSEPAAIVGSSDMLEVIINKGNAQRMLGVEKGATVSVIISKGHN